MANQSPEWNNSEVGVPPDMPEAPLPKLRRKLRIRYSFQRLNSSSSEQINQKPSPSSSDGSKTCSSCISLASASISSAQSPYGLSSPSAGSLSSTEPVFSPPPLAETSPLYVENGSDKEKTRRLSSMPESTYASNTVQRANYFSSENISRVLDQPLIPGDDGSVFSVISSSEMSQHVNLDFWAEMPHEIALQIFANLRPKELVRASTVCKKFREICYDGQLWTTFDASEFYAKITADSIARILRAADPFVKDLNLRGCMQLEHELDYDKYTGSLWSVCHNLNHLTLEGCRNLTFTSIHNLVRANDNLVTLNLSGLSKVTNTTCQAISQGCPCLEMLNISWCTHVDSMGVRFIIRNCKQLKDLRVGEIRGLGALDLAQDLFETNKLERFDIAGCSDFTDQSLRIIMQGTDPEIDIFTNVPLVPARRLRHLNISRCQRITDVGIKTLAHLTPNLQGLQLNGCGRISDDGLSSIIATTPSLTHLDLDEIFGLTDAFLVKLSQSPCAPRLEHLSISYCEEVGDAGMLPIFRACTSLKSVDMDNTKIGDLVLAEAALLIHSRLAPADVNQNEPFIGLRLVVYDCPNVTRAGVRKVLSHNLEICNLRVDDGAMFKTELVGLKCFYRWQNTVDEHTKRLLRNNLAGAGKLLKLWGDWMISTGENGSEGPGLRREREAQLMHIDDESRGAIRRNRRRRRGWSSGCTMM
ncbi:hypothetical protein K3495_g7844 [Podosphaera aphanis]|nr:hypothetical protein K3495_g7844 [Podosphaera aphanis]